MSYILFDITVLNISFLKASQEKKSYFRLLKTPYLVQQMHQNRKKTFNFIPVFAYAFIHHFNVWKNDTAHPQLYSTFQSAIFPSPEAEPLSTYLSSAEHRVWMESVCACSSLSTLWVSESSTSTWLLPGPSPRSPALLAARQPTQICGGQTQAWLCVGGCLSYTVHITGFHVFDLIWQNCTIFFTFSNSYKGCHIQMM